MGVTSGRGALGLFGGTFDPIHWGHLLMAENAREALGLTQLQFVPACVPPHKQQSRVTAAEHRVAMLEVAIADNPGFGLCRWEIARVTPSYTVETLRHMQAEGWGPIYLLIGGDSLAQLASWREPETIRQLATLVVVDRPGAEPAAGVRVLESPLVAISSTDIRQRVQAGETIRYRVPEAVRAYIVTHGLYHGKTKG
ncbi:MAG: nicotinate (nicotinamide) nucleotide adenylyltransferase [Candidatus Sericytochromatia bacterium]|nr:nicotinate (nicotinamide) nucleotide adenylyltransferase [Candidatus Sericytochromatia bacterium]